MQQEINEWTDRDYFTQCFSHAQTSDHSILITTSGINYDQPVTYFELKVNQNSSLFLNASVASVCDSCSKSLVKLILLPCPIPSSMSTGDPWLPQHSPGQPHLQHHQPGCGCPAGVQWPSHPQLHLLCLQGTRCSVCNYCTVLNYSIEYELQFIFLVIWIL